MIRQLAKEGLKLRTPKLIESIVAQSATSGEYKEIEYVITEESEVEFEWVDVGIVFSGVEVDVLGVIERIPIALYITYPGREVPSELSIPDTEHAAVMQIDLSGLEYLFSLEKRGKHMAFLKNHIENSLEGKSWFYHPRAYLAREKAKARMDKWLSQQKAKTNRSGRNESYNANTKTHKGANYSSTPDYDPFSPSESAVKDFKCLMCDLHWRGTSRHCTNCNTHFYATEAAN